MNKKDLDALNELYLSVYDEEQLNEAPGGKARFWDSNLGKLVANTGRTAGDVRDVLYGDPSGSSSILARQRLGQRITGKKVTEYPDQRKARIDKKEAETLKSQTAAIATADKEEKLAAQRKQQSNGSSSSGNGGGGGGAPPRPASGNVISAKNIAGQQQKVTVGRQYAATLGGNKGTVSYDASGKRTFNKTPDAPMRKEPLWDSGTPKPSSPTPAASAPTPAIGKLGNTSFERRTPTSAELRAAQAERATQKASGQDTSSVKNAEKALQAAQKTNLPTTGPSPAIPDLKSVSADLTRANPSATSSQIAGASKGIAPALPGTNSINKDKPRNEMSSYEWPSAKTIRDIAGAYASIYEAKKKVDQDQDGDNDFADVRVARMIASGVPKAKAIAMVKDKSYNEEVELWVNELVEEGYDLSEYTWEDMFDIYLNEGIGSAIRGLFSKKEAEAPKPQSRGDQLRARYNVGPEKSDTSAKRKILNRAKDNVERAQRQVDMGNASQSYADKAKEAHNSYLKAGYSKYGADLPPAGRGNKARKRAAAMTPREIKEAYETYEFVASYLLENNFANTIDDANVIINNMSEGWFNQIMEDVGGNQYTPNPIGNAIKAGAGLAKKVLSNPAVSSTINQTLRGNTSSGGYSTKSGDGKPYKDGPLWDGGGPKTSPKPQTKKQPPMRDEPLW